MCSGSMIMSALLMTFESVMAGVTELFTVLQECFFLSLFFCCFSWPPNGLFIPSKLSYTYVCFVKVVIVFVVK